MNKSLKGLEETIGYSFKNKDLLKQAMTHSSYANEIGLSHFDCNERLEFLGDAVLEIVTSEKLYFHFRDKPEGELSKIRASLVCEPALEMFSKKINLSEYILLSRGEEKTGGRQRASIISDCMESLIGAIYLDAGLLEAKRFIHEFILFDVENVKVFKDNKTTLQEILQARGDTPVYELIKESGPAHQKEFTVMVKGLGKVLGQGVAGSKKAAEQSAAGAALSLLRETED